MKRKRILMYSFKGGSGRTVCTTNIAYILAKEMERRVLCIDLDVESAGSSVLFEIDKEVAAGNCWTIQDALRGYQDSREYLEEEDDNVKRQTINLDRVDFPTSIWPKLSKEICVGKFGGYLRVIPARMMIRSTKLIKKPEEAQRPFETLMRRLDELGGKAPEIILFDSASGLQDTALLGLNNCNYLALFMRWSRQFVEGTINFIKLYLCNDEFCQRIHKIFLVPTVVPTQEPKGEEGKNLKERRKRLNDIILQGINIKAKREFGAPDEWIVLTDPIHECESLKWDDRIFLKNPKDLERKDVLEALDEYRNLANIMESASPHSH